MYLLGLWEEELGSYTPGFEGGESWGAWTPGSEGGGGWGPGLLDLKEEVAGLLGLREEGLGA